MNFDSTMAEAGVVELRVLHGPQAGSRLPLMPGAPYLMGAGEACDIMLAGAQVEAEHAHIEVDGDHWTITPAGGRVLRLDGQTCDANEALDFGTVVVLGRVKLTVVHQDAEWPQDEALEPQARPEPTPEPPDEVASEAPATPPSDAPQAAAPHPAAGKAAAPPLPWRRALAVAAFVAVATATLALAAYAAWQASQPPAPPAPAPAATAPAAVEAPLDPAQRMQRWMEAHGATGHLLLEGGDETPWRLNGYVKQDSERQRLLDAARELPWPLEVSVLTEPQRLAAVQRYAEQQPSTPTLAVRWLQDGRANPTVRVVAANQAHADEFIARMRRDLGPLEPIDTEVLLPPAVRHRFMERLERANLGDRFSTLRAEPDLALTALLRQGDLQEWEAMFIDFTREYGSVLRISAVVRFERDAIESRIRAVVAGAYPYVVTTSGQRVAPGGAIDGKTVSAVNAQEVVFSDGLRVRLRP